MPALADHAAVLDDHRANERIWACATASALGKLDRPHEMTLVRSRIDQIGH
jgi:hypothetical protein